MNCAETNIIQSPPTKDEDVSIITNELEKLDVFKNNLRIYTIRCRCVSPLTYIYIMYPDCPMRGSVHVEERLSSR